MKLRELNDAIAQTCDVRANVVAAVQTETFRQIRTALDKGEKVIIPEFGTLLVKEIQGEGGPKKIVRFREKTGDAAEKKGKKEGRKKKAVGPTAAAPGGDDNDDE